MFHRNRIRRDGSTGILLRFSLSYFLILLIPVAMSVGVYVSTLRITEQQVIEANRTLLDQFAAKVSNSLTEADNYTLSLIHTESVSKLMGTSEESLPQTVFTMQQQIRTLVDFSDSNRLITRYYLYSRVGDFILEPEKGYRSPERYYANYFAYADYSIARWREEILDTEKKNLLLPAADTVYMNLPGQSLLYVNPYYNAVNPGARGNERTLGKMVFYLDAQRLIDLLKSDVAQEVEWVAILDQQGRTLFQWSEAAEAPRALSIEGLSGAGTQERNVDGVRSILTYHTVRDQYLFLLYTPRSVFAQRTLRLLYPLFIGLAALLAFGLALTLLLLRQNRRPLAKAIEHLPEGAMGGGRRTQGGLWRISSAVEQLTTTNDMLRNRMDDQRRELRGAVYKRMVSGEVFDAEELDILLDYMGLPIEGTAFRGVFLLIDAEAGRLVDAERLERQEVSRTLVMELLKPYEERLRFLTLESPYCFACLLIEEDESQEEKMALLQQIYHLLESRFRLGVTFYVGYRCAQLKSVSQSFASARLLMDESVLGEDWIYMAEDAQLQQRYDYTAQDEQRLLHYARSAQEAELMGLLDAVEARNRPLVALSTFNRRLLLFRMADTLHMASGGAPLGEEIRDTLHRMTLEAFFDLLRNRYHELCEAARATRAQRTMRMVQDVLAYIDAHFCEADMSLTRVSLQFGVVEKYLSAFIKEKAGVHFFTYLERLRMEKANELLEKSDATIEEIARGVGYTNDRSFRRAYLRVMGYTPSARRGSRGEAGSTFPARDVLADRQECIRRTQG